MRINAQDHVTRLVQPDEGMRVLRTLRLARARFEFPARSTVERLLPRKLVVELADVALLEVLEAEIGAEVARRAVLECDTPVALERRRPHPLIRCAIGM